MELVRRCAAGLLRSPAALHGPSPWLAVARGLIGVHWAHPTPVAPERRRAVDQMFTLPTTAATAAMDAALVFRNTLIDMLRADEEAQLSVALPGGLQLPSAAPTDLCDTPDSAADTDSWTSSIWFAVPKRKTSYSKKRLRQMNPLYASHDTQAFYPCPKCEKGLLKLRHHLCPCDQETVNAKAVVKVKYAEVAAEAATAPPKEANVKKTEAAAAAV